MGDLAPGFPKFKEAKKKTVPRYIKSRSEKTIADAPKRKEVIDATHKRAKGKCEAEWIAPHVRCGKTRDADEIVPRSGGGSPLDEDNTQSLCRKCHTVKGLEVWASEVLGLYGEKRKAKHSPALASDWERALEQFAEAKEKLKIG